MATKKQPLLLIIDGHALAYRAYFALPPLLSPKGQATGAIVGFLRKLLKVIRELKPDHVAVIFDDPGPTHRDELSSEYKATRDPMPDELRSQIKLIQEIVPGLGLTTLCIKGVEADDVIATIALKAEKDCSVDILSGDKDLCALVSKNISLLAPSRDIESEKRLDPAGVKEKFDVSPEMIPEYLALMGDASDNIPGVPGVGKKTASKLLNEYGSIDNILESVESLKGKLKDKFKDNLDLLELSRKLVQLKTDVDLGSEIKIPSSFNPEIIPDEATIEALRDLALKSVVNDLPGGVEKSVESSIELPKTTILTLENIDAYLKKMEKASMVVVDTETTSLDPHEAELLGIAFAFPKAPPAYLSLNHKDVSKKDAKVLLEKATAVLTNPKIPKCAQNLKYDYLVLRNAGIDCKGFTHDTLVMSSLVNPLRRSHSLDALSRDLLGHEMIPFDSLGDIREAPLEQVSDYAGEDAFVTLELYNLLMKDLEKEKKLKKLYEEIEHPSILVLADLEWLGVSIDVKVLKKLSQEYTGELEKIRAQTFIEAGEEFNPASTKQLGAILFEKLGLPAKKKTKTGYSTNVKVLESLKDLHPLPKLILEYRELSKLLSTYVDALPEMVNTKTGRIHTSFSQTRTATGRLASSDPNLQNIPVRTERGRQIRNAFDAMKGKVLITADYSQIEFRIAAYFSQENVLLDAFAQGHDLHAATAAQVWNVPIDEVDSDLRRQAKAVNFGILYGQSAYGLSRSLGISIPEGKELIESYFAGFPRMKTWIDETMEKAREDGVVETYFGRQRPIPDIKASNKMVREAAERIAINTPIQGTASEIIKVAMLNVASELEDIDGSDIILQVHDELIIETLEKDAERVTELVEAAMKNIPPFTDILAVSTGQGSNWLKASH